MTDGLSDKQNRLVRDVAELTEELSTPPGSDSSRTETAAWKTRTLGKAGEVLREARELDESGSLTESVARVADRADRLAREPEATRGLSRDAVAEFGWSAGRIVIGAALGAAFGGPFVALALKEQVAEKVIEASIGGAVGAFANELGNKLTKAPSRREQEMYLADLEMRIKELERQMEASREHGDSLESPNQIERALQLVRETQAAERQFGDRERSFDRERDLRSRSRGDDWERER